MILHIIFLTEIEVLFWLGKKTFPDYEKYTNNIYEIQDIMRNSIFFKILVFSILYGIQVLIRNCIFCNFNYFFNKTSSSSSFK